MTHLCRCLRYWIDDDEVRPPDLVHPDERARHLAECHACREGRMALLTQRAHVREAFGPDHAQPTLSEAFVRRCLDAMARAAAETSSRRDGIQGLEGPEGR